MFVWKSLPKRVGKDFQRNPFGKDFQRRTVLFHNSSRRSPIEVIPWKMHSARKMASNYGNPDGERENISFVSKDSSVLSPSGVHHALFENVTPAYQRNRVKNVN